MKLTLSLEFEPFMTPNFVRVANQEGKAFPLKDLPPEALSALCDEFRREVFRKAGKTDPHPTCV
jgi:hypothetical protein